MRSGTLVVFDVDGTLTRSTELDALALDRAFRASFGAPLPSTDWTDYPHATDSGIGAEAARRVLGRDASVTELERLETTFLALLASALDDSPDLAVPGAHRALRRLREQGYAIAIATGCWRASAELKLERAGLLDPTIPMATADDAVAREAILELAVRRAGGRMERTVYVGDGLWDLRASRAHAMPFIGVDSQGTGILARAGAAHCIVDYTDYPAFEAMVRRALLAVRPRSP
jgi:phosphoglycolate phosphatase-like HAD superfamily hydrolase